MIAMKEIWWIVILYLLAVFPSDSEILICLQGSHMLPFPAVFPREKQIDRDENGDLEQVEDS